ncbi:hypothetical protein O3M35_004723 [Rhynocoris fuscipes]|uniref:BCD1 alpha/beta domain-containing protein n=1 Tax=Rhynocoris fuscipes TaxID=488301 RepID=A0AAW1CIF6_9HEMI
MDLQNDYILLEETGRTVQRISTEGKLLGESKRNFLRMVKLKKAARGRGIKLEFLPHKFTRHRENTTFLNWKTDELFWKIQWIFPEADNYTVSDSKVLDICTLSNTLSKYITPSENVDHKQVLTVYESAGKDGIKVLLKAEKIPGISEMVSQDKYIRAINENQNFLFSTVND